MSENKSAEYWFGDEFSTLHPLLRELHQKGGKLIGEVEVCYGDGFAGKLGERFSKKVGVPNCGVHDFEVEIFHDSEGMNWNRSFSGKKLRSLFKPMGTKQDGYWSEKTGAIELNLTVDIIEQAWVWRPLRYYLYGIRLPKFLFPKLTAFKRIENERYVFYVGFSFPIIGRFLWYSGCLQSKLNP